MNCGTSSTPTNAINGSPIEEISILKGLKQCDPLTPLIFLLVAVGLSDLMHQTVDQNLFSGVALGNHGILVSHLQYANDTLLMSEASVPNLWAMKVVLRTFEPASSVKVNFSKSSRIGVNVSKDFFFYG